MGRLSSSPLEPRESALKSTENVQIRPKDAQCNLSQGILTSNVDKLTAVCIALDNSPCLLLGCAISNVWSNDRSPVCATT
jgi:hypothetical protein